MNGKLKGLSILYGKIVECGVERWGIPKFAIEFDPTVSRPYNLNDDSREIPHEQTGPPQCDMFVHVG
jgi:hypothetical protein